MLKYASDFQIQDDTMTARDLQAEGRTRLIEMTQAAGFMPSGETEWTIVELWDGLHLLGVTPVKEILQTLKTRLPLAG